MGYTLVRNPCRVNLIAGGEFDEPISRPSADDAGCSFSHSDWGLRRGRRLLERPQQLGTSPTIDRTQILNRIEFRLLVTETLLELLFV